MATQKKAKNDENLKKIVFTSKMVTEVTDMINDGVVVKRFQNPWFKNEVGVRRSGVTFRMSEDEIQEYIRCKLDIHYFAEKYCKVKTEDGSVNNITLREYQKDILDLFSNNRFSILLASRQVGKCFSFNTICQLEDEKSGIVNFRMGKLYYYLLEKQRKLTFLEKLKIKLYDWLFYLESAY